MLLHNTFTCVFTRGPRIGQAGKVLLLFDDNPLSKVGVRFDKPIPDGVDFGGLCDSGHGFFCHGDVQLYNYFTVYFFMLYGMLYSFILYILLSPISVFSQ